MHKGHGDILWVLLFSAARAAALVPKEQKRKSFHVFGQHKYMEALAPFAETKLVDVDVDRFRCFWAIHCLRQQRCQLRVSLPVPNAPLHFSGGLYFMLQIQNIWGHPIPIVCMYVDGWVYFKGFLFKFNWRVFFFILTTLMYSFIVWSNKKYRRDSIFLNASQTDIFCTHLLVSVAYPVELPIKG